MLAISVQRTFAPHRFETSADIGLERCQQMFADLIRKHGPQDVRGIELLTMEELQEIRQIWVVDKHELEDSLPLIYQSATGEPYPGAVLDDDLVLGASEMSQLKEICDGDRLHYELSRALLSLTRQQRNSARRAGLFEKFEKTFAKHFYDNEQDALQRARTIADERDRRRKEREKPLEVHVADPESGNHANTDQI